MKSKIKVIVATALGTTLFWVGLIGLLFLSGRQVDHIKAEFLADEGALGMFYRTNTKTQNVVLVIEELPMNTNATDRVELLRREVAPQQSLRIEIRELAGTNN
ncbi:MAG TPA: hypothetical protein VN578_02480 [Candidatus Binatia bacterium]|nr:hypothetical protein [Candidatus Binatia bacterium]